MTAHVPWAESADEKGSLIGDEISTKVGRYVLGNFLTSVIASIGGRLATGYLR